jgi:hypothetical protein
MKTVSHPLSLIIMVLIMASCDSPVESKAPDSCCVDPHTVYIEVHYGEFGNHWIFHLNQTCATGCVDRYNANRKYFRARLVEYDCIHEALDAVDKSWVYDAVNCQKCAEDLSHFLP